VPPEECESLVKQTYSVFIRDEHGGHKKWHLTAYFSQSTVDDLGTVDELPDIASLPVPEGRYRSARSNKNRYREEARRLRERDRIEHSQVEPDNSSPRSSSAYTPNKTPAVVPVSFLMQDMRTPLTHGQLRSSNHLGLTPLTYLEDLPVPRAHRHPEDEKVLRSLTQGR